ncbi:MAG TPA: porin family protein, partial [Caulobacteraceae bacterium]|nr:porin family protein [Caulobacteraceae bacterium]
MNLRGSPLSCPGIAENVSAILSPGGLMKKHIYAAFAAGILAAAATPALAADERPVSIYGNVGATVVSTDVDSDSNLTLGAINGRVGARFAKYVGVEGELAFGVTHDTFDDVEFKIDNEYAVYAVGFIPLSPKTDLFARVGYGHVKISGEFGGVSASAGSDSVNYGGGAQFFFDENNGVRLEYTRFDLR